MSGIRLLRKHGVEYNVLVTVNRTNGDHPLKVYRFLRDEVKTSWIQFIPAIERLNQDGEISLYQQGSTVSERSVTAEQWGHFLITVYDEWVRKDVGKIFVQTFEAMVRAWMRFPSSGMCIFDPVWGHGLAIEHTEIFTPAITSSNLIICSATSARHLWLSWPDLNSRKLSDSTSQRPCRATAVNARYCLPVKGNAPGAGLYRRRMARLQSLFKSHRLVH